MESQSDAFVWHKYFWLFALVFGVFTILASPMTALGDMVFCF
jgi:hypothetical protein